MMKKSIYLTLFLILTIIPLSHAIEEGIWMYNAEYLVLETEISSSLDVVKKGGDPFVEYVEAELSFYPKITEYQSVTEASYDPVPSEDDDKLLFRWDDSPGLGTYDIQMQHQVRITSNPKRIREKISFPISSIPSNMVQYTLPAEIIDVNDDIISLASSLAEGEDDMVVVVDNIAHWVTKNINYNLSTATSEATQKASWVLDNRNGVCDELTSLFIAMLRSLNIPARFVAGISYTTSEYFTDRWGAHGWAEVYFPGHGWIPYDVTYGQYGFVDPTHVVARYSADAEKISSKYKWKGKDMDVTVHDLQSDVNLVSAGRGKLPPIELEVDFLKGSIDFDSYNLAEVTVTNLADYYQPIDVNIARTTNLEIMGEPKRHLLLKPYDKEKLFWIVKVPEGLDENYMYNFPIVIYTIGNVSGKEIFHSAKGGIRLSKDKVESEMREMAGIEEKVTESGLDTDCSLDKEEYYGYETPHVKCTITNTGNKLLGNVEICIEDDCQKDDIGITQSIVKEYDHTIKDKDNEISVSAGNSEVSRNKIITFRFLDEATVDITGIRKPDMVDYREPYKVSFLVEKVSSSNPQDVRTKFELEGMETSFKIDDMSADQRYELELNGADLLDKNNKALITVKFKDKEGKRFEEHEEFTIKRARLSFIEGIEVFFKKIGRWITNLF